MDLQVAKLTAFAICTEADAGIMGWKPGDLNTIWEQLANCATIQDILVSFPPEHLWKWDNYWAIWGAEAEIPAPDPGSDRVELTEKGELALEESEGAGKARTITLTQKGEAAAQAAELEIHAEAEAKNLEGSQPPTPKRAPRKGR